MLSDDNTLKILRSMRTLQIEGYHHLKVELAGIRVWVNSLGGNGVVVERIVGGYWQTCTKHEKHVLDSVMEKIISNDPEPRAKSADFVVAINFDLDGLAQVMAEQHNDAVIDVIRRVVELKDDPHFNMKLSKIV